MEANTLIIQLNTRIDNLEFVLRNQERELNVLSNDEECDAQQKELLEQRIAKNKELLENLKKQKSQIILEAEEQIAESID